MADAAADTGTGWLGRHLGRRRSAWRARATARDRGDVLLGQRRVYILPTRAGLGFGVLLLVLLIGSVNYNLGLGFGLTFVAAGCAVADMLATWRNLAGLTLRPGRAPDVFAGEEAPFELHVLNGSRLDRYAVWIDFEHAATPRHAVDVDAGGSAAVVLGAPTTTRGWLAELLLDFDALPARLDLELRLSRVARWVLEAEGRALPYALRVGRAEVEPALGAAHQAACLRALALYGRAEAP
ncbi:hypothetical protein QPK32_05365 [Massilia sp. YIM B02763]|uniref:hypothetical protein n=1 Tax=Massilia sp. YIM B02763 TaxID=3050130 RepID=UPI0025B72119|nr:hypothetical protein [Massilia sp. YIM B02763]MDN4052495.1 hypothetical protein [Massilia sp. YIM B02763]